MEDNHTNTFHIYSSVEINCYWVSRFVSQNAVFFKMSAFSLGSVTQANSIDIFVVFTTD